MTTPGHNSGGIAAEQLQQFIQRIERLEEEKKALAADIREVHAEARSNGFATGIIRQILRERKLSQAERDEREALLDTYRHALGMLSDTPLGQAALGAATNASGSPRA